jgi:hypothetical protein
MTPMKTCSAVSEEKRRIRELFRNLMRNRENCKPFPSKGLPDAPREKGVYIIAYKSEILHVGVTQRAKNGLQQRLNNHLNAGSSFTLSSKYLCQQIGHDPHQNRDRSSQLERSNWVRKNCNFWCLPVSDARDRMLLEHYAIAMLCPHHIGTGSSDVLP